MDLNERNFTLNTENTDSLINRGLSFNIGDINNHFSNLFRRYSITLNKINGFDLFGNTIVKQIQNQDGVSIKYRKGDLTFRNKIDDIQYLIDNRSKIYNTLGLSSPSEIYDNRRNLGKIQHLINEIHSKFDIGKFENDMQMYISKTDSNDHDLDELYFWTDYIMNSTWVDSLSKSSIMDETKNNDYRIDYLVNGIHQQMNDHIEKYHKIISQFDKEEYIDKGDTEDADGNGRYIDALNKLNSFDKLSYGLYEIFKPIGGSSKKYLKIKMSSSGKIDIQGVLDLKDCVYIPWEHGSPEYLRSLNTGNRKYEFKLSIPFSDDNSTLWWKPDEKEQISSGKYRYYKEYELERCLRWFGTDEIPKLNIEKISRKTICSIPNIDDDIQNNKMFGDSINLVDNSNFASPEIDNSTSLSLLSLFPKSTIEIVNKSDGQYLQFIIGGHQQTERISFSISSETINTNNYDNHFGYTIGVFQDMYDFITKSIVFINATKQLKPYLETAWKIADNGSELIPEEDLQTKYQIANILSDRNTISLIRLRTIDIGSLSKLVLELSKRIIFIQNIKTYIETFNSELDINLIYEVIKGEQTATAFFLKPLFDYTTKYNDISDDQKNELLFQFGFDENYILNMQNELNSTSPKIPISYDTTVSKLREQIQTFNNLIVRLPIDTYENKITSLHIFKDWKNFVDNSLSYLINQNKLFKQDIIAADVPYDNKWMVTGTDGIEHDFTEYYTDSEKTIPFIDYSYCYDKDGNVIHDRWDFWTEEDFS